MMIKGTLIGGMAGTLVAGAVVALFACIGMVVGILIEDHIHG